MNVKPASPSSRGVIGAGLATLAGVLLLIVFQDEGVEARQRPRPDANQGPSWNGTVPAADLAVAATPGTVDRTRKPIAGLPQVQLPAEQMVEPASSSEVAAAPDEFAGRLFACHNTLEILPIEWVPDPAHPSVIDKLLGRTGVAMAHHRLSLSCHTDDLHTVPVEVYFDVATAQALPAIGRDSDVTLQLLGTGPTGNLVARFINITENPRNPGLFDMTLPDLLAALLQPTEHAGRVVICASGGPPTLVPSERLDAATRARLADRALPAGKALAISPAPPLGALVQLTCSDRRALRIPVLVQFRPAMTADLLRVAKGTLLSIRLQGSVNNRLVAIEEAVLRSGVVPQAGDLRQVLVQPSAHLARTIACTSMGLPMPQVTEAGDPLRMPNGGATLADRKAWLVCGQANAPPVHLTLYFKHDDKKQLLSIIRGSRVEVQVLGTAHDRILGVFERTLAKPTENAAVQAIAVPGDDMRRFGLLTEALVGKAFPCKLGRDVDALKVAKVRHTAQQLFDHPVADPPVMVECLDSLRPSAGQRFEVFFADDKAKAQAKLRAGMTVDLRFAGVMDNLPVTEWIDRPEPRTP